MQRRRWCGAGRVGGVHVISGVRDPAVSFPLAAAVDDRDERHQANRAVAVSATGLAVSGLVELVIALVSGSAALLGDALHNLSDVSTSLLVFVGFRASRRAATPRYPYGFERAEDLAGIGVAAVIWASAAVAGTESVAKLVHHGTTQHLGWGIAAAAAAEILGNQLVARYKLAVGRRIQSATMIADAKHSWLDALSSAGAARPGRCGGRLVVGRRGRAGIQLSQVNEESSVTNVRLAVLALVGSDARHGTSLWPSR